ncbi:MAG: DUF2974 domain-containing protein [Ruminococcus sp.]|nr:DUF2974 domain-containing protein [Ruminococcus sp.]
MANILDYLDWRGDIPFSADPFNEADGLILSQFVYVPLNGIVPSDFGKEISLKDAFAGYSPSAVDEKSRIISFDEDNILFEKMAQSQRFGNIRLTGYIENIDTEKEVQFRAVSCILEDGTVFISYSGTDDTVIGWKEDFNISYMQQTSGQLQAVSYLNDNFKNSPHIIRTGGHSKGGNFAIYASVFCDRDIKNQIAEIYSYDAPGFREEITQSWQYINMLPRIKSYVPETSVVGMLLNNSMEHRIVKSSAVGIKQHISYNWEIMRNRFVLTQELSKSGHIINKALSGWIDNFSDEERKLFTDTLFSVLEAPEKDTIKEISKNKWSAYSAMFRAIRGLSAEQQAVIKDAFKKIAKSSREALLPDKKENVPRGTE